MKCTFFIKNITNTRWFFDEFTDFTYKLGKNYVRYRAIKMDPLLSLPLSEQLIK